MKNLLLTILVALCSSLFLPNAQAQSMLAECSVPTGSTVVIVDGQESTSADKMSGVNPTFLWKAGEDKATIVMRGAMKLGGPESFDAIVVPTSKKMISFIAHFEAGLEVYSLFLDSGLLIMSSHKDISAPDINGSGGRQFHSGKTLTAKCKIKVS